MNNRQIVRALAAEEKQKEEKTHTPIQNIAIEDINSSFTGFLQKPEINEDLTYPSLVKIKKDLNTLIKCKDFKSSFFTLIL